MKLSMAFNEKSKRKSWNKLVNKMSEKLYEVLHRASLFLEKHGREPRVAEILLQHHLQVSRSEFFMRMREDIPNDVIEIFQQDIHKHVKTGVPVQHVTGYEMFFGEKFHVNADVLIPRPETEELVEHAIRIAKDQPISIADIGTGSGVIAVTLAKQLKNATVLATDISPNALHVAKQNAEEHHADVTFYQGNFLEPLVRNNIQVDMLVSNPPYIARAEETLLSDTVKNFDPALALFADEEGLYAYRKIIADAPKVVKPQGKIIFEIGHTQGEAVSRMMKEVYPTSNIQTIKDINGNDRIVSARL